MDPLIVQLFWLLHDCRVPPGGMNKQFVSQIVRLSDLFFNLNVGKRKHRSIETVLEVKIKQSSTFSGENHFPTISIHLRPTDLRRELLASQVHAHVHTSLIYARLGRWSKAKQTCRLDLFGVAWEIADLWPALKIVGQRSVCKLNSKPCGVKTWGCDVLKQGTESPPKKTFMIVSQWIIWILVNQLPYKKKYT